MNNLGNIPKWGNFGQSGVNLDSGKKGQILVELVSLGLLSMIWAKKVFEKNSIFFYERLKKRWGKCWTANFIFLWKIEKMKNRCKFK